MAVHRYLETTVNLPAGATCACNPIDGMRIRIAERDASPETIARLREALARACDELAHAAAEVARA